MTRQHGRLLSAGESAHEQLGHTHAQSLEVATRRAAWACLPATSVLHISMATVIEQRAGPSNKIRWTLTL